MEKIRRWGMLVLAFIAFWLMISEKIVSCIIVLIGSDLLTYYEFGMKSLYDEIIGYYAPEDCVKSIKYKRFFASFLSRSDKGLPKEFYYGHIPLFFSYPLAVFLVLLSGCFGEKTQLKVAFMVGLIYVAYGVFLYFYCEIGCSGKYIHVLSDLKGSKKQCQVIGKATIIEQTKNHQKQYKTIVRLIETNSILDNVLTDEKLESNKEYWIVKKKGKYYVQTEERDEIHCE